MSGELERWGAPVSSPEDRQVVEIWCEDELQRAWLLRGQTAESLAELHRWLTLPTDELDGAPQAEATRADRPLADTWVRPANVVSLADYRARRAA